MSERAIFCTGGYHSSSVVIARGDGHMSNCLLDENQIAELIEAYGSPLYVFHEEPFVENYKRLAEAFRSIYPKYNVAYSYKTNYAPYICGLAKSLGGYADLDFKNDAEGNPVLMEINPRIAAAMRIFKEGGMNLPYLRIKHLLGEKLPDVELRYGAKMKRRYLEMFAD